VYGVALLLAGISYYILQRAILRLEGPRSTLASAIGRDLKGKLSPVGYALAIPLAFVQEWLAWTLYVVVALIWLVPDRRIERIVSAAEE
jgi:TMEM175 potassium channel family protein